MLLKGASRRLLLASEDGTGREQGGTQPNPWREVSASNKNTVC